MSTRVLVHDVGKSAYFNELMNDSCIKSIRLVITPDELMHALETEHYDVIITDLLICPESVLLQGNRASLTVDGYAHIKALAQRRPAIAVVVLSRYSHIENVIACYQAGARWFVQRTGLPDTQFTSNLLSVVEGKIIMPAGFDELSQNRIRCGLDPALNSTSLTDQELIFELLRGSTTAQIIETFGWKTPQQLYNRMSRIVSNAGFESRDDLLEYCRAIGLVGVAANTTRH